MKHLRLVLALAVLCPVPAVAQIVVTAPAAGNTTLKAADDFATRAFQDPWDMNQKTDVGPLLGSADVGSGWSSIAWANGLFSGTTAASDAQLWLLDTAAPGTAQIGKTGANYPIDIGTYKVLVVRMHHATPGGQGFAFTWPNNIYEPGTTPTVVAGRVVAQNWNVYYMDLSTQSGLKRAFRFDPAEGKNGESVSVDWARLVSVDPNLCRTITWTGSTIADIYLDDDNIASNGYIGLVQGFAGNTNGLGGNPSRATPGCSAPGSGFNLYVGGLSAGTYRVFLTPVGVNPSNTTASYSPGTWTVNDIPTLQFTSPMPEGSDDDFAASQLGDAWDMDKLADIDSMVNVNNPQITTLTAETPEGAAVPNTRVFLGTSAPGAIPCPLDGDPQLTLLSNTKRGASRAIDTDRYRLLTLEFGIPNAPRDLVCGSIARVIWRQKGQVTGSVSEDIIFNQRGGVNMIDKITLDLKALNVEDGVGTGGPFWVNGGQGGVDLFRFDPHEFSTPTNFYVKRIKLADFERAKTSYTIRWNYSEGAGTVDLYYDTDRAGFDGVPFATNISATAGQYAWTIPPGLPTTGGGTPIYIYAMFRDTTGNENRVYAPLPIYMDANYAQRPRMVLSRTSLNFGARSNTTTATAPQTVRLTFVGAATTTPCWTVSADNPGFQISPSSGTGNATLTVSLLPQTFPGGGIGTTTFTVNEAASCAGSVLNPGQQFTATFRITTGAAPIGAVDTPADGQSGITGSLGVTGWVIDDIDINGIRIYRNAMPGEPADGLGRVFLGNASRVDDARPDVAAANPTAPFNYRGGWGYLLLTNFLPNLGNGTFVLSVYATDVDGHEALLGQRTITVANSTAVDPFGAIDTPGQGETVTGTVNNFGWVLMRGGVGDPHADPPHGGAVSVVIDGLIVGSPTGWVSRPDLASLFPKAQFDGVDNALGVYTFNSAAYQDGVHTIAWLVVASNGRAAGIGSRFFTTVNGNGLVLTDVARHVVPAPVPGLDAFPHLGRPVDAVAGLDRSSVIRAGVLRPSVPIAPDATGLRTVFSRGLDRVVVDASAPGARSYEAYQVAGGRLTPLPVGASFDERRGVLYWQPGLAFTGSYDFVVVRDGVRVPVRVVLSPERRQPANSWLVRGLFATE